MFLLFLFHQLLDHEFGAHGGEGLFEVFAHRGDLADEAAGCVCETGACDDEGGFDAGDFAVGDGLLDFVLEVREISHASQEDVCAALAGEVDGEAIEGFHSDECAVGFLFEHVVDEFLHHIDAFFGAEERVFARVAADGDDEFVKEFAAACDDVEMAEGDGVEGAGVEGDVFLKGRRHVEE